MPQIRVLDWHMLWEEGYDSGWDEALHAHCEAAEASLLTAATAVSCPKLEHQQRLAAKPVLGGISLQISPLRQSVLAPCLPTQQPQQNQTHHLPPVQVPGDVSSDQQTVRQEIDQQHSLPQPFAQQAIAPAGNHFSTYPQQSRLHSINQQQVTQHQAHHSGKALVALSASSSHVQLQQQQQPQQQQPQQSQQQPQQQPTQLTQEHIKHAAHVFSQRMHTLPPLPPRHSRCPGVYSGQGCGAPLRWVTFSQGGGCWGCSSYPACDYREAATERLASPQVTLEAVDKKSFKIEAALGGQDVVCFCGGLAAVLVACGVPIHKALPQGANSSCQNASALSDSTEAGQLMAVQHSANSVADIAQQGPEHAQQAVLSKPQQTKHTEQVLFDFKEYDAICSLLQNRQRQPSLLGSSALIPHATLASLRGGTRRATEHAANERFSNMPPHLRQALMPFQKAGVHFALRREGRLLLADEMGVGKTVQAIAIASCYKDEWPLLIIVPASLRLVWAEELEKWLPHLRPSSIHVIEGKSDRLQGANLPDICITSYEMMQRLTCDACKGTGGNPVALDKCSGSQHCLASKGWKIVIADESHTLRTSERAPDASHTEAAISAVRRTRRAIFLTGTPSLSRPFDLFRQVDALRPGILGKDRSAFSFRYCNRRLVPVGRRNSNSKKYDNSGLSRAGELHTLLKEEVMLRRLKRDVMAELPPKRRQVVRLPRPRPSDWPNQEIPEDAEESSSEAEGTESRASRQRAQGPMSKSHQTGLAKLPYGLEWLMNALGGTQKGTQEDACQQGDASDPAPKFLIFAHHKDVMSQLANALEGQEGEAPGRTSYVRVDGDTDSRDRRSAVLKFREDPTVKVALLSITAAGTGLDFSAASAVVFVELPQEVALVRQAEDRAHRHGQKRSVNVYFLVAKGTSDERRWQALSRSLERVVAVHGDEGDDQHGLKVHEVHDMQPAGPSKPAGEAVPSALPLQQNLHQQQQHQEENLQDQALLNRKTAGSQESAQHSELDLYNPAVEQLGACTAAGTQPDPSSVHCSTDAACSGASGSDAAAAAEPGDTSDRGATVLVIQRATASQPLVTHSSGLSAAAEPEVIDLSSPVSKKQREPDTPQIQLGQPGMLSLSSQEQQNMSGQLHIADSGIVPTTAAEAAVHCSQSGAVQMAVAGDPARDLADALCPAGAPQAEQDIELHRGSAGTSAVITSELDTHFQHSHPAAERKAARRQSRTDPAQHDGLQYVQSVGMHKRIKALLRQDIALDSPSHNGKQMATQDDSALALTQAEVIQAQTADQQAPQVWFEVSAHTNRVHFHADKDGSQPLGLSLPIGCLQGSETAASVQDLLEAVDERTADSVHVGAAGVLALPDHVTRPLLEGMLSDAKEFVAEWLEMRPVFQHRLFGQCMRAPLQDVIEEVQQQAAAEGAFGRGTSRYTDLARPDLPLPAGAAWSTVKVKYSRWVNPVEYQQAFTESGDRLCICCLAPVTACVSGREAVLQGAVDLFCGYAANLCTPLHRSECHWAECEGKFCTRSSGGALRRALFKLERGVCTMCRLDCHDLVTRVRTIERGCHRCDERRRARILTVAPGFGRHGSKAYLDRLTKQAVEGNAWHADHIVAVYQGGGLCDLENLRTLCVICHQDVTKQQAKERAAARRLVAGQGTLDKYLSPGSKALDKQVQKHMAKASKGGQAGADNSRQAAAAGKKRSTDVQHEQNAPKRPKRRMVRIYTDEDDMPAGHPEELLSGCSKQDEVIDLDAVHTEDADFQPARKKVKKVSKKGLAKKQNGKQGGTSCLAQGSEVVQADAFSNFRFCDSRSSRLVGRAKLSQEDAAQQDMSKAASLFLTHNAGTASDYTGLY